MKKRLIALMLLGGGFVFAQVSIGISIGPPPPPRIVRVLPARPAPEFVWIDGYWYPVGNRYRWHAGYWSRPAYPAARWVAPRHDGERFYHGYWDGERGRIEHDHHWDRDRDRDFRDHDRR
jgi:YXWGXW repeat-containing protein